MDQVQLLELYVGLRFEFRKLLDLVSKIKSGEVNPDRINILGPDAWELMPIPEPAKADSPDEQEAKPDVT